MSPLTVSTVVVGFDGSPAAERAVRRAAEIVAADGRVVLVAASPALLSEGPAREPLLDAPTSDERDLILARGEDLLRELGVEMEPVASDADPATAITDAANARGADLIIVGATGTGYVTRAILGSTPTQILRSARCDVLVVR
jgi:nucleotide-binding universal stress UspA family protein